MDSLQAVYRDDDDDDDGDPPPPPTASPAAAAEEVQVPAKEASLPEQPNGDVKASPEEASDDLSESAKSPDEDEDEDDPPPKKQKQLSSLTEPAAAVETPPPPIAASNSKKSKKKNNNVWVTKSTRKGKKKSKSSNHNASTAAAAAAAAAEDTVLIAPVARFPDKTDDSPESKICLSKVYKAEKVELSEDRLSAGSAKGYRMVRATRGVVEGAWYFEIKVAALGDTGHTRLGWSTEKADLQAPVGYDGNSFGYRDTDGSKVHKALRESYGAEGYKEGDVIGFYINLPDGAAYAPKDPQLVVFKGQRYACATDSKDGPPKLVPGSEILFFKNGVSQGVAFKDLQGGRYYPAASMYTLPNQPNCMVKFNFGPDFEFFPEDFGGRPSPTPMINVPYHGFDTQNENGESGEKKPLAS